MSVLGNRITLHSPSRGFSMELGAAITVVLASQYGLPVSVSPSSSYRTWLFLKLCNKTTMCITGATLGVALCNGDWRATNWRAIAWIFVGWIFTVPIAVSSSLRILLRSGCSFCFQRQSRLAVYWESSSMRPDSKCSSFLCIVGDIIRFLVVMCSNEVDLFTCIYLRSIKANDQ